MSLGERDDHNCNCSFVFCSSKDHELEGEAKSTCGKRQPSRPQESHAALMAKSFIAPLFSPTDVRGRVMFFTPLVPAPPLSHAPAREEQGSGLQSAGPLLLAGGKRYCLVSASSPSLTASNQGWVLWADRSGSCPQCRLSFRHSLVGASHSTA